MIRLLFLTFILSSTISTYAQVVHDSIQKQLDSFKISKVDTVLVYSLYCNGGLIPIDTCASEPPQYIFWVRHKSFYIKKFDYCRNYKAVLLDSINPLLFYLTYKNQIDKEEIKVPTYVKSKKGNIVTTITMTVDHTCIYDLTFQLKKRKTSKTVTDYNLTFKRFDNGKMNMYYNLNQKTKLKALIDQLKGLIRQLNMNNKFQPE